MTHCSEDDLVLHYYGEDDRPAVHLAACAACADRYRELAAALDAVGAAPVPERGDQYPLEVWQQIRHRLPDPEPWWHVPVRWQWAAAGMVAVVLMAAGFGAGRISSPRGAPAAPPAATAADEQAHRRVLLLTVADHLERSDRILTEIANAPDDVDISREQQWAVDLVAASRLYRQDAVETNEMSLAAVLDDLERTLLEIAHYPATATASDREGLRRRIDAAALLFKIRVLSDELRDRDQSFSSTIG